MNSALNNSNCNRQTVLLPAAIPFHEITHGKFESSEVHPVSNTNTKIKLCKNSGICTNPEMHFSIVKTVTCDTFTFPELIHSTSTHIKPVGHNCMKITNFTRHGLGFS